MADLDDFFSKRDKKKKGTAKSKFPTLDTDEFVKQLEATTTAAEVEAAEVEISPVIEQVTLTQTLAPISSTIPPTNKTTSELGDGEEWKPFESDDNIDYTGLRIKIQHLKEDDQSFDMSGGYDECEKRPLCPWRVEKGNNLQQDYSEDIDNSEVVIEKNLVEPDTQKSTIPMEAKSAYVPPAMRLQSQPASYRKLAKNQPNINDITDFPSLGGNFAVEAKLWKTTDANDDKFEIVKKSSRVDQKSGDNPIDLGNKFTPLSANHN